VARRTWSARISFVACDRGASDEPAAERIREAPASAPRRAHDLDTGDFRSARQAGSTWPGSTVPPGTMRTTFNSPESFQEMGEYFAVADPPQLPNARSVKRESMRRARRMLRSREHVS